MRFLLASARGLCVISALPRMREAVVICQWAMECAGAWRLPRLTVWQHNYGRIRGYRCAPPVMGYHLSRAEESNQLIIKRRKLLMPAQAAHWFDYDLAWPELARVVRPGGTVAFVVSALHIWLPIGEAHFRFFTRPFPRIPRHLLKIHSDCFSRCVCVSLRDRPQRDDDASSPSRHSPATDIRVTPRCSFLAMLLFQR